jgi:hypothetical protein
MHIPAVSLALVSKSPGARCWYSVEVVAVKPVKDPVTPYSHFICDRFLMTTGKEKMESCSIHSGVAQEQIHESILS